MKSEHIEVAQLVAYLDGELDGELDGAARREVEVGLARDSALRAKARLLAEDAGNLRAAYNEALSARLPMALLAAVERGFADLGQIRRRGSAMASRRLAFRSWWRQPAFAASLLAVFAGLASGYFFSQYRVGQEVARLEVAREADRLYLERIVSEALERQVSGQTVDWHNPDSGSHGVVVPVRTYKSEAGQWCREYAADSTLTAGRETRRAIACRLDDGVWRTRLQLIDES